MTDARAAKCPQRRKSGPFRWPQPQVRKFCRTNGRRIVGCPFLQRLEVRKAQRYKWGAYWHTNWRCFAALASRPVGVGVSETLLRKPRKALAVYFRRGSFLDWGLKSWTPPPPPVAFQGAAAKIAGRGSEIRKREKTRKSRVQEVIRVRQLLSGTDLWHRFYADFSFLMKVGRLRYPNR